eukprot:7574440-Pyramimonas_sp.AAC.1
MGAPPTDAVAVSTCVHATNFGTPYGHPCPHMGSPADNRICGIHMPPRHPDEHATQTFRGPTGSCTEGHSGGVYMCRATPFGAPPRELRGPIVSGPHRNPQWRCSHALAPTTSAHPSHISLPHGEIHRKTQWWCRHASSPPM